MAARSTQGSRLGARRPIRSRMVAAALIRLRYPADCRRCGRHLAPGTRARWDRDSKRATCCACFDSPDPLPALNHGIAGASAAREWARRSAKHEQRIREAHPRIGGLILALDAEPQSTTGWAVGAQGEIELGAQFDTYRKHGIAVLHDRRIPQSRANIDHLLISTAGVFVVDAKRYRGKVERRDVGGLFRSDVRLYVDGRDRTKVVRGLCRQVAAVKEALAPSAYARVPVTPVVCFVDAEWNLFARPIEINGVQIVWPRAVWDLVTRTGPLSADEIASVEATLARMLRPA